MKAPEPVFDGLPAAFADAGTHRVELDGGWSLWRWSLLRSAGFPVTLACALSAEGSSEQAHREEETDAASPGFRRRLEAERAQADAVLREVALRSEFREAILWQTPLALLAGVDLLARGASNHPPSSTRKKERLAASYLQRYCAKNETIGFFGPLSWGEVSRQAPFSEATHGPTLLALRRVFFEHWAIDRLAEAFSHSPELRLQLAPRLPSLLWLEAETACLTDRRTPLSPGESWLLRACDGRRSAGSLAKEAAAQGVFGSAGEATQALESFATRELLAWRIEIPTGDLHPERSLRQSLERLDGPGARLALAALSEVEAKQSEVAAAAGDPQTLAKSLQALGRTFSAHAGSSPSRRAGESSAGRQLVFEDCRRDVSWRLGNDFLARFGAPLALLLESARWYSYSVAQEYRVEWEAAYDRLALRLGKPDVPYPLFYEEVGHGFESAAGGLPAPPVLRVLQRLQERWIRVLGIPERARRAEREPSELAEAVAREFEAPNPGWPRARYHSPDLLPIRDLGGRGGAVLGELHPGVNTLLNSVALEFHPDDGAVRRAYRADGAAAPVSIVSRNIMGSRGVLGAYEDDEAVELADALAGAPPSRRVRAGDLVVRRADGRLVAEMKGRRLDLASLLQTQLAVASAQAFRILPVAPHSPRLTLGPLVVCREAWLLRKDELPWVRTKDCAERFLGARRWASQLGLPRFVFVKTEGKPRFTDLESPLFIDILAKMARQAAQVEFTEMLPTPEDAPLVDPEGRRYTAEVRLVAVDPRAFSAQ